MYIYSISVMKCWSFYSDEIGCSSVYPFLNAQVYCYFWPIIGIIITIWRRFAHKLYTLQKKNRNWFLCNLLAILLIEKFTLKLPPTVKNICADLGLLWTGNKSEKKKRDTPKQNAQKKALRKDPKSFGDMGKTQSISAVLRALRALAAAR